MTTRRGGRPSKGDRSAVLVRMPRELREQVEALAAGERLPLCDYLTRIIAEAHDYQPPAYCYPTVDQQGVLPIAQAS